MKIPYMSHLYQSFGAEQEYIKEKLSEMSEDFDFSHANFFAEDSEDLQEAFLGSPCADVDDGHQVEKERIILLSEPTPMEDMKLILMAK